VEQRPVLLRGTVRENRRWITGERNQTHRSEQKSRQRPGRLGITPLLTAGGTSCRTGVAARPQWGAALRSSRRACCSTAASSADAPARRRCIAPLAKNAPAGRSPSASRRTSWEDAYRWADDVRGLAEGRLSPVTPENLFRVDCR